MQNSTFVLVHGAWHNAQCWSLLTPRLEAHGHTVIAPDLPGHGENPLDINKVSLKVYSSYISQLIDNIDNKVVLVGHSMAGMVISQVAENSPEKIEKLIYLNAYLPCDGDSLFEIIALNRGHEPFIGIEMAIQMSMDKRSCSMDPNQIIPLFYNLCSDEIAQKAKNDFCLQASLPLSTKVTLSEERFGKVHKSYICALQDKVIPVHHQRRMLNRQSCEEMIQLDTDHSSFYSCPQELADILNSCSQP